MLRGRKSLQNVSIHPDITKRKRVEKTLWEGEKRFRLMADSAPVLIWMSGTDKACNFLNRAWLEFTGRSMEQELGSGWVEGVHAEDRERSWSTYATAFAARQTFAMEYRLRRQDGAFRWILDTGKPRFDPHGDFAGYIGSCVDITDHRQAGMSVARLAAIVESSDDAIIGNDLNSIITSWNKGAEKIFGYTASEMVGASILRLIPADRQNEEKQILGKLMRGERLEHFETQRQAKDGRLIDISITISPIKDAAGKITGVSKVAHDFTERKRAETELQVTKLQLHALVGRLHNAHEEEAKRIARGLHDDLGQQLTVLNLELSHLEAKLSSAMTPQQLKQLARMHTIVANMIGVVQNISGELRLGQLDVLGLTAAVDWQLMEFSRRSAIPCRIIRLDEIANLSAASSAAIFRILQETLTNIVRHAGATKVEVSLLAGPDQVTLEVRDNGRGITLAELKGPQAIGLLGMRERAQLVSGEVTIASEAGMGTTVLVRVPVNRTGATPP